MCVAQSIDMHTSYGTLSDADRKKVLYGVSGTFDVSYVSKFEDGRSHKAKYE